MERSVEAMNTVDMNKTLNKNCNTNNNIAVPRVQKAPHIPTDRLKYRDPDASVTISITKCMETNSIISVDEVRPPKKQVLRGDKLMDAAIKTIIAKRKQSVLRVDKRSKSTKTKKKIIATQTPIAS